MATGPTGLGPDHAACTDELVTAMRARLNAMDPPQGDNVDDPGVRPNFEALGSGVHAILTVRAQPLSTKDDDPDFWAWTAAVITHLADLRAWQQVVRQAVQNWAPADTPGQQFRQAFLDVPLPGQFPGPVPEQQKGHIR
ncbi:hypothetical protein [Streptomyces sp. NPDC059010]|uniref:hypothetical protein n=1 Tax=Streptomyces sp. NPDC059010 TaxID=3346695 RepID=UPI00367B172E